MAKKKSDTKTTQQQSQNYANTASYGWQQTPDSEDIKAFRAYEPQKDPGIGYQYANQRNKLNSSFIDPMGGYGTAQTRDAQLRTGLRSLGQDEAQAHRLGQYDVNQQKMGQLGSLAALTAPRLTQTGSTGSSSGTMSGTSNTTQGNNLFGDVLQVAGTAAAF